MKISWARMALDTSTRDGLLAFHRSHYAPDHAAIAIAGDISMAELKPLADKAFGAWVRGAPVKKDPP